MQGSPETKEILQGYGDAMEESGIILLRLSELILSTMEEGFIGGKKESRETSKYLFHGGP